MTLPADVRAYPDAIAQALTQLRLAGVNGPYSVVLGADAYTAVSGAGDHGYPVISTSSSSSTRRSSGRRRSTGGFVLTTRGGDFDLHLGQDISIGYLEPQRHGGAALPAGNASPSCC